MNQTKEYDNFSMLEINRNLNRNHINKIKESIRKNGYIISNPIIVDKDLNIIDGQHRFIACKEMGLPINYEIIDLAEDIIIDLNTTQKKWNMGDYINYYANKGNANYQRIKNLKQKTNVSYDLILTMQNNKVTSGTTSDRVRKGCLIFSFDDTLKAQNTLAIVKEICNNIRLNLTSRFAGALVEVSKLSNFKWERMLRQSKEYSTKAYKCQTKDEYINMLKNLYNFRSKTELSKI